MIRRLGLPFLSLVALVVATPAYSQEFKRLQTAIPDFDADRFSADYAKGISEVVRDDLFELGGFSLIDTRRFVEDVDITLLPRFSSWVAINTRVLVIGSIQRSEDAGITARFRVYDPYQERQIHTGQLTAADPADWEDLAHRVADDIRLGLSRRRS